jgi:hypothetical protein
MAELENGLLSVQSLYVRKELHETELAACQNLWAGNLYYFVHLCVRTCVCVCVCVCFCVQHTHTHTHKHIRVRGRKCESECE